MNLGKISYWIGRTGVQANKVIVPMNFMMLIYLTTQENPLWVYVIPIAIVGGLSYMWFDRKKVVGEELAHWFDLNPRFRQMETNQKKIMEELNAQRHNQKST